MILYRYFFSIEETLRENVEIEMFAICTYIIANFPKISIFCVVKLFLFLYLVIFSITSAINPGAIGIHFN